MKRNLFIVLSFVAVLLAWCTSDQISQIDPATWTSKHWTTVDESFSSQLNDFQYIQDLENYLSFNRLSISQDQPYTSDFSFSADFDKNSSVQWWIEFSQSKISKSHDLETSNIQISIKAEDPNGTSDPFDLFWNLTLLYQNNEMYAKLHQFQLNMWEWNAVAKMYSLLSDLLIEKWVNLEVNSWWVISIDQDENERILNIVSNLKNTLAANDTVSNLSKLINAANWFIDLWISADGLQLTSQESTYFQDWKESIQKSFTWHFEWSQSAFDLSFTASKNWLDFHLYNIQSYDSSTSSYVNTDAEFLFSIQQDGKSEYLIDFASFKSQQKTTSLNWTIKYGDTVKFSADFILEPLELISWESISWELKWTLTKKSWAWDSEIPELTGNILSLSDLLSSL
jgi:hypothetical protein